MPTIPSHFNLRDLGGIPSDLGGQVAPGRLFRGASFHRAGAGEIDVLRSLGIRTVVDLRMGAELQLHGSFPAAELDAVSLHLPMIEELPRLPEDLPGAAEMLAAVYAWMPTVAAPTIVAMLDLLADPGSCPALFYCAAGKDRTGVLAAIVLGLLGVGDEEIVRDYAASHEPVRELTRWLSEHDPGAHEHMVALPRGMASAPAPAMRSFLAEIRATHGSVEALVRALGTSAGTIDALRRNLLTGL